MPWTQINFPLSMKKLPTAVRKKAIEIANALLKKDKKLKEGVVIATAIKNAKALIAKSVKATSKKKVAVKKSSAKKVAVKSSAKASPKKKAVVKNASTKKVVAKSTVKGAPKKKVTAKKSTVKKGATKSATKATPNKKVVSKKVAAPVKKKAKVTSVKKTQVSAPVQKKVVAKKKIVTKRNSPEPKEVIADTFVIEPVIPEVESHGEDQNFIPEAGDVKPSDPIQIHNFENVFHHREEVAMHQENKKVNDAKASRKSYKRTYRMNGNR